MKKNKLTESQRNFLDRMHSQTPRELTEEDKKVIAERWREIEEYERKHMK